LAKKRGQKMLKRALIGTSLLLLELVTTTFLASLKASKAIWYVAKSPFFAIAKALDHVTNFFNAPISAAIDKFATRIKNKYGSSIATAFVFAAYLTLETASIIAVKTLILNAAVSLFSLAPSIAVLYLIHYAAVSSLIIAMASITFVAMDNWVLGYINVNKPQIMVNDMVTKNSILPFRLAYINKMLMAIVDTERFKKARATVLESKLLVVFGAIETAFMIPVNILNKPMLAVQRYLKDAYANQDQKPQRTQQRLAQLQIEISGDAKPTITPFSSKEKTNSLIFTKPLEKLQENKDDLLSRVQREAQTMSFGG
jgi:hypothetical protein